MKFPWTFLVAVASLLLPAVTTFGMPSLVPQTKQTDLNYISDATIKQRLHYMNSPVRIEYDPSVRDYIHAYVVNGYKASQRLLGRTALYFPTFEHYLKANRLPEQLKYLPVIESRLQPSATSSAGAAGLWQFTKGTGRQYKLTINDQIDERRDPIRSTEAAVEYLSYLYGKYQDWALVLAAYNCGPGRLNQAIREAGGVRDYWKVRAFLPKETQDYVPRFIAASYLMHYYHEHGIVPAYPDYHLQLTRTVKIFQPLNFQVIANSTALSKDIIAKLNPSYQRAYIPASNDGYYLILPEDAMRSFLRTQVTGTAPAANNRNYIRRSKLVESGDTIQSIARAAGCTVQDIQRWNQLADTALYFRQELTIYVAARTGRSSS